MVTRIGARSSFWILALGLLIYVSAFPLVVETTESQAQQPAQAPMGQPGQAGRQTQEVGRGGRGGPGATDPANAAADFTKQSPSVPSHRQNSRNNSFSSPATG